MYRLIKIIDVIFEKASDRSSILVHDENRPLVSICCITYNHEEYIAKTIDSFLMQKTDFDFEILIHDDASTDRTGEIIREYADKYPDIIFPIIQEKNQYSQGITNISGAFNFPRARGKYICMCEGDDYWTDPDKLAIQADYMERHPDCTLCFHSAAIEVTDGSITDGRMRPYKEDRKVSSEEIIDKPYGYPMASMMFPTEYVRELPDYYVNCPIGDIPLQLMLAAGGYGYYFDRDMSVYRIGSSVSWSVQMRQGDYEAKQDRYFNQMKATYEEFDKETFGMFHDAVESAIKRIYFLTRVNTKKFDEIKKKEYRRYYKELNLRTRFFLKLEMLFPGVFAWLQRLVHR
ncbi:MAG: glycosyltransferase [Lachnospiraceae bacterium]|nr:glycosyltransferase [Lachnospiraceae bacterium]